LNDEMSVSEAPSDMPVFTEKFQAEIRDRFGLTETFVRRLFDGKRVVRDVIDRWEDLINPEQSLSSAYIHFALSNVVRGRQARDLIVRKTGIKSGRSLDVGSAYGGMVAAFAEGGFAAEGVEIDTHWCELGNLNCRSKGFGDLIRNADFLAPSLAERYDVISCNDVIEHVHEPRRAIEKMASMLDPGGVLYLVIPNAWSWDHVVRDGHYGQFGMNLLDHYAAQEYYNIRCLSIYQKAYSCGEFYPLDWYREQLAGNGLDVLVNRATSGKLPSAAELRTILEKLDGALAAWDPNGLPEILHDQIVNGFHRYRERLVSQYDIEVHAAAKDVASLAEGATLPRRDASPGAIRFAEEFLDSFWTVIATKRA
jgi:2-polyprenyl-3-methyl-5-hydroxy-6-metoxy-1,4-benzoquinol methylase